jgi:hypothetical protein
MIRWLSGGGVKIKRAKEHIGNLEAEIEAFLKRSPYQIVPENDYQAGKILYRARIPDEPPLRLGAIAGDILHNLRSALDILWRNVWYPDGGGRTNRSIAFPIFDTANDLETRYPRHGLKKRSLQAAVSLIYAIKPYKDGNDLLWMLHQANAADKHRLLIPAYARFQTPNIEFGPVLEDFRAMSGLAVEFIAVKLGPDICPVKDGTVLFSAPLNDTSHVDVYRQATLDIAFGECEPIKASRF